MTETFLFVRLGEGEVYRNVVWKLQKCHDGVGGDGVDMKSTADCQPVRHFLEKGSGKFISPVF